jgi:hypothetical protein
MTRTKTIHPENAESSGRNGNAGAEEHLARKPKRRGRPPTKRSTGAGSNGASDEGAASANKPERGKKPRPQVKINAAFKDLAPPLSPEQGRLLLQDAQKVGKWKEPFYLRKETGELLTGYSEYEICEEHKINYDIKEISLSDDHAALVWACKYVLLRLNPTRRGQSYILGKLYKSQLRQGERSDLDPSRSGEPRETTAEELGKLFGFGEKSIRRFADFAVKFDELAEESRSYKEPLRQKVLAGRTKLTAEQLKDLLAKGKRERTPLLKELVEKGRLPGSDKTKRRSDEVFVAAWQKLKKDDRPAALRALLADDDFKALLAEIQGRKDKRRRAADDLGDD